MLWIEAGDVKVISECSIVLEGPPLYLELGEDNFDR